MATSGKIKQMKTATLGELREHPAELLAWIEAGEEVAIRRDDVVIARLVPEKPPAASTPAKVDWSKSAAFCMDKSKMKLLSQEETDSIMQEPSGSLEASLLPGGWRI